LIYPDAVTVPRLRPDGVKPRVFLVDDHRGVLNRVSALLAHECDVVGTATDGRQALDAVRALDPDAIVLDINMPGLNGFQTMQALEQAQSRTPVVFLSLIDADEEIREAFRRGGRGYVVKTRMADDLGSAIDQVIAGRQFAPTLTSMQQLTDGGGHTMQLYGESGPFLDELGAFFDRALRRGDATCLIAEEDIREGLATRLRARGWDVGRPGGHSRYLAVDAAESLNGFIRYGLPDADRLATIAREMDEYRRAESRGASSRLTIFGNMSSHLIADGNTLAAKALERVWHGLTQNLPFYTVCGYPTSCFNDDVPHLWSNACAAHSAVSHSINV
jgi:CheY-like chemotaxis protein